VEDIQADTASWRGEDAGRRDGKNGNPQEKTMMERILASDNLAAAWKRVRANKGAPGIDGMSVEDFPAFCRKHWPRIRQALMDGTYTPAPVRRVFIPKPDGNQRPLGVPTVLDRVIQQAVAQVLNPVFEPDFSQHSYGFREGLNAHQAVRQKGSRMERRTPPRGGLADEFQPHRATSHDQPMAGGTRGSGHARIMDQTSLRAECPSLIGTARYGPVRRVVLDPWLAQSESVTGTRFGFFSVAINLKLWE
jgi:hypothetical protein